MEDGDIPFTNYTLSQKEKESKQLKDYQNPNDFEGSFVITNFAYAKDCGLKSNKNIKDEKEKKKKAEQLYADKAIVYYPKQNEYV